MENITPQTAASPAEQPATPPTAPVMNGSVMDIQPPRSVAPAQLAQSATVSVPLPASATVETEPTIPSSRTQPVLHGWGTQEPAAPKPVAPSVPTLPTPEPVSSATPAQPPAEGGVVPAPPEDKPTGPVAADTAKTPVDGKAKNLMAIPSVPMRPHKRLPVGAFVAVLVGCALIGLAVFVYAKQNNNSATANSSKSSTQAADTTQPITATDVDTAVAEIDKSMADMDDTADFAAADLSDTTLELQ